MNEFEKDRNQGKSGQNEGGDKPAFNQLSEEQRRQGQQGQQGQKDQPDIDSDLEKSGAERGQQFAEGEGRSGEQPGQQNQQDRAQEQGLGEDRGRQDDFDRQR